MPSYRKVWRMYGSIAMGYPPVDWPLHHGPTVAECDVPRVSNLPQAQQASSYPRRCADGASIRITAVITSTRLKLDTSIDEGHQRMPRVGNQIHLIYVLVQLQSCTFGLHGLYRLLVGLPLHSLLPSLSLVKAFLNEPKSIQ
ncbi:hypothetical protein C8F04DRAFT_1239983 [Mycena alexandri]|uniref:Uncharacterized protein n=1 Tax=Mycena alexandri TaxID=1745969 RepID=A0AAD6WSY4_9AGAR|nr:hypothetical protein C8F04DRAFT_1239983 [Mycena alexandri]